MMTATIRLENSSRETVRSHAIIAAYAIQAEADGGQAGVCVKHAKVRIA